MFLSPAILGRSIKGGAAGRVEIPARMAEGGGTTAPGDYQPLRSLRILPIRKSTVFIAFGPPPTE